MQHRDHCPPSPFLRPGGYGLRSDPLPGFAGAQDRRPGPSSATGWLGTARCVRDPAPSPGGAHGQGRQAGIRAGPAASGEFRSRGSPRRGEGCPAPGCDRLRCGQAPGVVSHRAAAAQTRPGYLSLSATGQRGDHGGRQLYELVARGGGEVIRPDRDALGGAS